MNIFCNVHFGILGLNTFVTINLKSLSTLSPTDKIFSSFSNFQGVLTSWRKNEYKTVFTNGCFDLVHKGHSDYLFASANYGDRLIVGLNTDLSVKLIKGERRPICNELSRAHVLASMYFVDAVIFFDDLVPLDLIKKIKPNVLTKGSDYDLDTMVGADFVLSYGGIIKTISLTQGYSSSKIIKRIESQIHEAKRNH